MSQGQGWLTNIGKGQGWRYVLFGSCCLCTCKHGTEGLRKDRKTETKETDKGLRDGKSDRGRDKKTTESQRQKNKWG